MLVWSYLFLALAVLFYISSYNRIARRIVIDNKVIALICMALFLVTMICLGVSMKTVCPAPNQWINLSCFRVSMRSII